MTGWSDSVSEWVLEVGAVRLGWVLTTLLCAVLLVSYGVRAKRR